MKMFLFAVCSLFFTSVFANGDRKKVCSQLPQNTGSSDIVVECLITEGSKFYKEVTTTSKKGGDIVVKTSTQEIRPRVTGDLELPNNTYELIGEEKITSKVINVVSSGESDDDMFFTQLHEECKAKLDSYLHLKSGSIEESKHLRACEKIKAVVNDSSEEPSQCFTNSDLNSSKLSMISCTSSGGSFSNPLSGYWLRKDMDCDVEDIQPYLDQVSTNESEAGKSVEGPDFIKSSVRCIKNRSLDEMECFDSGSKDKNGLPKLISFVRMEDVTPACRQKNAIKSFSGRSFIQRAGEVINYHLNQNNKGL